MRLLFDRRDTSSCSEEVAAGLRDEAFPAGQPTTLVEFVPTKAGTFEFTCGMGMLRGDHRDLAGGRLAMSLQTSQGERTATIPVSGMTCASCTAHVAQALKATPGVKDATVNLLLETAHVRFDPEPGGPRGLPPWCALLAIAQAQRGRGDRRRGGARPGARRGVRDLAVKAIVGLAAAALGMLLSMPVMSAIAAWRITQPPPTRSCSGVTPGSTRRGCRSRCHGSTPRTRAFCSGAERRSLQS